MKLKKMSFAHIEDTMCKEEMKAIMGGSGTEWGGTGGSYTHGGTSNMFGSFLGGHASFQTPAGQAAWVSSSNSSTSGNNVYSSSLPTNYTKGWIETSNGITTDDPAIIKRLVDYLDWERIILKNEPTMTQVNNFVNMDYLTGGKGTLSDGSTLAQGMSITHDPYGEFKTIENLSRIFQNLGDSLTIGGAALSTTGVGAIVGGPMMAIGGGIARVGFFAELYLDLNSKEPFDYAKWGIKAGLELAPRAYTELFSKRAGAVGFDNAMVEMYSVASDRWFEYMGTVRK